MSWKIGLSSGSVANLSATQIVNYLKLNELQIVDLRWGKGHKWEEEGIAPFQENGIEVIFIGINTVLGDKSWDRHAILSHIQTLQDFPLKLFARIDGNKESLSVVRDQIKELVKITNRNENILLETHFGFCNIDELRKLHEWFGIRIVLDTMGLAKISADPLEDVKKIAPYVHSVQVKGFDWDNPSHSRHIPLQDTDIDRTKEILDTVSQYTSYITLESKAGCLDQDFKILKRLTL